MSNLPRIGFLSVSDPEDAAAFSGVSREMRRALEAVGHDVLAIGGLPTPRALQTRARRAWALTRGKQYLRDRDPRVVRAWGTAASVAVDVDVVVAPSTLPVAYLQTPRPVAIWTDAAFGGMVGFYDDFSNLTRRNERDGRDIEDRALANVDRAIYSSRWALETAVDQHGLTRARGRVVMLGSNLAHVPDAAHVVQAAARRDSTTVRALFVGMDWARKGGDIAVDAITELRARGIQATLDVVGCDPGITPQPAWLRVHGRLDRARPADVELLQQLRLDSHVLLLPTRAECTALVVGESNAWAVPAITSDVGGMADVVSNRNGRLLPATASGADYADAVVDLVRSDAYPELARTTRQEFDERLSWNAAARTVSNLLVELVGDTTP